LQPRKTIAAKRASHTSTLAAAPGRTIPCSEQSPDLWFSELPSQLEIAKRICRPCPVRASCLAGALARGEPWGVWGGEIFLNGEVIAVKRGRGRPPKHAVAA
jgi:WhiB family redox-sensing transcriptional regulator